MTCWATTRGANHAISKLLPASYALEKGCAFFGLVRRLSSKQKNRSTPKGELRFFGAGNRTWPQASASPCLLMARRPFAQRTVPGSPLCAENRPPGAFLNAQTFAGSSPVQTKNPRNRPDGSIPEIWCTWAIQIRTRSLLRDFVFYIIKSDGFGTFFVVEGNKHFAIV